MKPEASLCLSVLHGTCCAIVSLWKLWDLLIDPHVLKFQDEMSSKGLFLMKLNSPKTRYFK
jgi:hypothetical protein